MFYLSEVCLLCLSSKQLKNVLMQNGNGIAVQEELKYCLPEITFVKSGIPEFICSSCRTEVHSFYKFKKKCLKNYNRLIQFTQILQGSNNKRSQKFSELKIQINKLDLDLHLKKEREQDVDSALNIKVDIEDSFHSLENHKQRTANIDVKEEDDLICTELRKPLNNQEFIREREQEMDNKLNIKIDNQVSLQSLDEGDHKPILDDEFELKHEFVACEDSDDKEFYLKYLKNESAFENEEDSASTISCEDENQPNVDEADFWADTDNANGEEYKHNEQIEDKDIIAPEETAVSSSLSSSSSKIESIEDIHKDIGQGLFTLPETLAETELRDTIKVAPSLGKRCDKRQCCKYCMKLIIKLPRHLINSHANEPEVAKFMKFQPKSKERKLLIENIRNKGNYIYNYHNKSDTKHFIVKRRPTKEPVGVDEYLPCQYCLATYNRRLLHKHVANCKNISESRKKWSRIQIHSNMMTSLPKHASVSLTEDILCKMKLDNITDVVKNDQLILKYGTKLYLKHGHQSNLHSVISAKMRELARLLIELKNKKPEINSLQCVYHPQNFELLKKGVRNLTGYNDKTGKYEIPTLAKKLGDSLKYCSRIFLGECIKSGNIKMQEQVKNFNIIFDKDWTRNALSTLYEVKWNKLDLLILSEDMIKLNKFINEQLIECEENLRKTFSYIKWNKFRKILLSKIILFNRRRVEEAQRLTISNFQERAMIDEESEVYKCLTVVEKAAAKKFVHVEIRGERGRKVPLLLTTDDVNRIQELLKYRQEAGVAPSNPFVFGRRENRVLRGSVALNYVAQNCGAQKPNNLTSTNLQKHIATSYQILNLSDNQMDYLANYMGHDIEVQRNFYRLPDNAIHLAKISKLLLSCEKGNIEEDHSENLEDINLEEEDWNSSSEEVQEQTNNVLNINDESVKNKTNPRKPWTEAEKNAVKKHLNIFIKNGKVPRIRLCKNCKKSESEILKHRTWIQIKGWCYNEIKRNKLVICT